jgi:uncharacterized protein with von Willebrand factor type A (vWA) domain
VPSSAERLGRFVRATTLTAPATLDDLYWIGRITLVSDRAHLDPYDRVFDQVFRGLHDWADSRGDTSAPAAPPERRARRQPGTTTAPGQSPSVDGSQDAGADGRDQPPVEIAVASREERLATTDFAELTDDELRDLRELMREIQVAAPLRPARRHRRHPHGDRLDLRATLRRSRRTGGDPIDHVTRRARERPRKVVMLCDISGSMAPYSRACLQLLHAAAGGSRAEVFTFATRLTRVTRALSAADPDAALALAAATAPDWKGGTRIGDALKEFLDRYGRRGLARGAVVVIVSDGWDRGAPELVGEQMARLGRLAHRIVWINPRNAAPGFAPLAGGMAAAFPHCDALVSGNTLVTLGDAMGALGALDGPPPRPRPRLTRRPPRRARGRGRPRGPRGT